MIDKLHARCAENASARWCRAKGAAYRDISSSYARARKAERQGGSERDTVLHLAKASVSRPWLLQLSSPALATRTTIELCAPDMHHMSQRPQCIRCRKTNASSASLLAKAVFTFSVCLNGGRLPFSIHLQCSSRRSLHHIAIMPERAVERLPRLHSVWNAGGFRRSWRLSSTLEASTIMAELVLLDWRLLQTCLSPLAKMYALLK